ncbi:MAG TPA: Uma2 family endonuclease [Verrucomicrobiales bacterium]|nr:Uma2 family endonuclease [Verrucomicrobiales bacterium]
MIAPTKHRFTVVDYHRMAETGVLSPDARVELLNGEIIDLSPIGPFHGGVTKYLIDVFSGAAKSRWKLSVQDPVCIDEHSQPQPDVMLLRPAADFYRRRHPQPKDVFLLIEVADTSLEQDREVKLPAYGRAGIAEVWIVNLNELTVEVHREPHFEGYAARTVLKVGDHARPAAFPDVVVDVAELLKR